MALSEMGAIFACAIGWLVTVIGTIALFARKGRP
jgi:hypothetical protein